MNHLYRFLYLLLFAYSLISCGKDNNDSPPPPSGPTPDTLSTGWTRIKVDPYIGIFYGGDIFFNSNTTGFVSDNNSSIFKSADGGSTWTQIYRAGGRSLTAGNMAFTADNKAFFVSSKEDSIFRTTDLGATITGYSIPGTKLSDIFFGDNNTGLSCGSTGIYKTTNGGNSWSNISTMPNFISTEYSNLYMFGATNAWVCYGNKIFHANGNLSTFKLDSITGISPSIGITSVFATSASTVYVSSYTGYIFKSVDGGNNFSLLKKLDNVNGYASDIYFIDANNAYVSVGSRIYKTIDGGNNWAVVVALGSGSGSISEIHFTDATHGWACTTEGYELKFN